MASLTAALPTPAPSPAVPARAESSAIDAALKVPLLLLIVSATLWLVGGTVLALIAAWKLQAPAFLADCEWLTYGRVQPAALNAWFYGWGVNVALALGVWLLARLGGVVLGNPATAIIGALFWNLGVTIGVGGILAGYSSGVEGFEMPAAAGPVLFVAYALIGIWAAPAASSRRAGSLYASQWYVLAALLWLPWLGSITHVMLFVRPSPGTVQAIIEAWFSHNLLVLGFTPVALAIIYYLLPKLLGRPINGYYLAVLGFWTFAFFSAWGGPATLAGGPVPLWVPSIGVATTLLALVPAVIIAINHFGTLVGHGAAVKASRPLQFVAFSAVSFVLATVLGGLFGLRSISITTQFTHVNTGYVYLVFHAVFGMAVFGALVFVLPRLVLRAWPSTGLSRTHFLATAAGIIVAVLALVAGGWVQGGLINATNADGSLVAPEFIDVVRATQPYLFGFALGLLLILIGQLSFLVNLALLLCPSREVASPALFRPAPPLEVAAR